MSQDSQQWISICTSIEKDDRLTNSDGPFVANCKERWKRLMDVESDDRFKILELYEKHVLNRS